MNVQCVYCERWIDSLLLNCPHCSRSTHDEKTDALTDMAYYHGARHALAALGGGMSHADLMAELEVRAAPARRWLAEHRGSTPSGTGEQ